LAEAIAWKMPKSASFFNINILELFKLFQTSAPMLSSINNAHRRVNIEDYTRDYFQGDNKSSTNHKYSLAMLQSCRSWPLPPPSRDVTEACLLERPYAHQIYATCHLSLSRTKGRTLLSITWRRITKPGRQSLPHCKPVHRIFDRKLQCLLQLRNSAVCLWELILLIRWT
jgi:hypothetical protein